MCYNLKLSSSITCMQNQNPDAQKILIIGAECTGKSTLCQALANEFNTIFTPEYMRIYLNHKPDGYICQYKDLIFIAQGQIHQEKQLVKTANKYLFCDTSLLLLKVYSEHYFNNCPQFILDAIPNLTYSHIFLTDNIGITWVADGQRDLPNGHDMIYQKIIQTLDFYGLNYHHVSGELSHRINQVRQILHNKKG